MKRFNEGFKFSQDPKYGMTSIWSAIDGTVIIPYERETGQLLFRWVVE